MKYNKEYCSIVAKKYNSIMELRANDNLVYQAICRNKWNNSLFKHMSKNCVKKTFEECYLILSKFDNIREAKKQEPKILRYVKHKGWLQKCTSHMKRNIKWTYEKCKQAFLECKTANEVQKNFGSAYNFAYRNGYLEEFSKHFIRNSMELTLLKAIQVYYPAAKSEWFGRNKKGEIAKRFQLDIFIRELNVGIEFDGLYWHSFKGLRQSRKKWPIEMVKNYHNIKNDFFHQKGISIIHVGEETWIKDSEKVISDILKELEIKKCVLQI